MKFDLHNVRAAALFLSLSAALCGTASAQTTTTTTSTSGITLATGTWTTTINATINGHNSTELVQKVQMELAKMLPAGIRENTLAMLNSAKTRVRATTCVTAQTAPALSSPAVLFNTMSKMNPRCTFKAGRLTATTQYFTGTCFDPLSFTGPVSGKVVIKSPTAWQTTFSGDGQMPDPVLQALWLEPGAIVTMQTTANATLTSSTCPTTTTVASAQ